jgi:hypothetical protein
MDRKEDPMKALLKKIAPLFLLSPYICAFSTVSADDPEFSAAIAAGGGSYAEVSRGCNGEVISVKDNPYQDYAVGARYKNAEFIAGVTGGTTTGFRKSHQYEYDSNGEMHEVELKAATYVTPSIGFTTKYIGMELGYVFPLNDQPLGNFSDIRVWGKGVPSAMLRVGRFDALNFSASMGSNFPLLAGGGLIDAGFGFPLGSSGSRLWCGLGGYPYDGVVFSAKGEVSISELFTLTPALHAKGGDASEYGYAIGVRVKF